MVSEHSKAVPCPSVKTICLCGGYGESSDGKDVIRSITIGLEPGSFTAIIGPNGSGKSTFLKHLIRELKAKEGRIFLCGNDISSMKQRDVARLIACEGQHSTCSGDFTVAQIVALGRYAHGDERTSSRKVMDALEKVGIAHLSDKSVTRISGGEFQLAMLARAICQDTDILVLDEPINNLDPKHQRVLMDLLVGLYKEGKTVVCVLHDINAALRYCTHCAIVKDGRLFAYGKAMDVITTENLCNVYGIEARMVEDPVSGCRIVVF